MASYKIDFTRSADKELNKIDRQFVARIVEKIGDLEIDPYSNSKKLVAKSGYRLRVGDYRVIFEVFEDKKVVLISKISHRKNVYKTND